MKFKLWMILISLLLFEVNVHSACNVKNANGKWQTATLDFEIEDKDGNEVTSYYFLEGQKYYACLTVNGEKEVPKHLIATGTVDNGPNNKKYYNRVEIDTDKSVDTWYDSGIILQSDIVNNSGKDDSECVVDLDEEGFKYKIVQYVIKAYFFDDFTDRSLVRSGLKESVMFQMEVSQGADTDSIYPLKSFNIASGKKSMDLEVYALDEYFSAVGSMTYMKGTVTVTAEDKSGGKVSYEIEVIAPEGISQVKTGATAKYNTSTTIGVGFNAVTYLEPTDVSFYQIKVGENTCNSTTTGGLNNVVHPSWPCVQVGKGDEILGCRVEGPNSGSPPYDCVRSIYSRSVSSGSLTWEIPWDYEDADGKRHKFTTTTHKVVTDGKGKITLSKSGISVTN